MKKALVILSGGQDSTTCLFKAIQENDEVISITFDYGQRHLIEIESAKKVAEMAGVGNEIIKGIELKGNSPLTNKNKTVENYAGINSLSGGLENTFVPGRNMLFLSIAANYAYVHNCDSIYIGVSESPLNGYPDCRQSFVTSMQNTIALGLDRNIKIKTPLIYLSKKQTVLLAKELPGCWEALAYSHTCYNANTIPCGKCRSCLLREQGFKEAGLKDPLIERTFKQGVII